MLDSAVARSSSRIPAYPVPHRWRPSQFCRFYRPPRILFVPKWSFSLLCYNPGSLASHMIPLRCCRTIYFLTVLRHSLVYALRHAAYVHQLRASRQCHHCRRCRHCNRYRRHCRNDRHSRRPCQISSHHRCPRLSFWHRHLLCQACQLVSL